MTARDATHHRIADRDDDVTTTSFTSAQSQTLLGMAAAAPPCSRTGLRLTFRAPPPG